MGTAWRQELVAALRPVAQAVRQLTPPPLRCCPNAQAYRAQEVQRGAAEAVPHGADTRL